MRFSGSFNPQLYREQGVLYMPNTGSDGTGAGYGPPWVAGGTVSHPTPTNSFTGQFRRTRFTDVAGVNNQELGVHFANADAVHCWRGAAVPDGGFHFTCRFIINAIPDNDIRFFAGLSATTGAAVCISDTVPINTLGLWCKPGTSAAFNLVSRAGSGSQTDTAFATATTLTTGILYEFTMHAIPAGSTIVTQLRNVGGGGAGTLLNAQNLGSTLPATTALMAPQVGLSNATHLAGNQTSLDLISIYTRPNILPIPSG